MLRIVWPSLYFWYFLGLFSSFVWFSIVASMIFRSRKDENLGDVVYPSATYLPWYFGNFALWSFFQWLLSNPNKDHLFPDYERIGKIIGVALLFIGNILVYYLTEKSVALMLVFLFVAISFLSTLYYLQPYTDFGVLDFLVTASLNLALTLFGLRSIYTWLVLFACFVMAALRYLLEPTETPEGEKRVVKSKVERWKLFKCDRTHGRTHQN